MSNEKKDSSSLSKVYSDKVTVFSFWNLESAYQCWERCALALSRISLETNYPRCTLIYMYSSTNIVLVYLDTIHVSI